MVDCTLCRTKRPTNADSIGCSLGQPGYPTQQQIEQACRRMPSVIPPLELGNVEGEIARGNDVERPVESPLELRPESLDGVRVRRSFHVLSRPMLHRVMVDLQNSRDL